MLLSCPYNIINVRSCGRFEDASVICQGIPTCIYMVLQFCLVKESCYNLVYYQDRMHKNE